MENNSKQNFQKIDLFYVNREIWFKEKIEFKIFTFVFLAIFTLFIPPISIFIILLMTYYIEISKLSFKLGHIPIIMKYKLNKKKKIYKLYKEE